MKKIISIFLFVAFTSPVFSQITAPLKSGVKSGFMEANTFVGTQSLLAEQVGQKVYQLSAANANTTSLVPINNWVTKPFIRVKHIENGAGIFAGPVPQADLSAQVLNWNATAQYLLPQGRYGRIAYMPSQFVSQKEKAFFRGIKLTRLGELKNLLINGLERKKVSSYFPGIYVAKNAEEALPYAIPWGALYPTLPVMIKIPDTPELAAANPFDRKTPNTGVFRQDVKPRFISDVVVFLNLNGPGWYKVILVEDEMIFIPIMGNIKTW